MSEKKKSVDDIEVKFERVNKKKKSGGGSIFLILIVVGLSLFLSSLVITYPDEYRIIRQFGTIIRVEQEPGLSFKLPIIQEDKKIDKKILFYDIAPSDVITSDKKSMIVDAYVLWRVTDAVKYMQTLSASNTNAEARLNTIVYSAIKNTVSNMTQNEVILSRDGKVVVTDDSTEEITNDIIVDDNEDDNIIRIKSLTDEIKENLADCSDYGIEIVKAEIKVLDLPSSNKATVYTRMISERENVAASYRAQGEAEAQKIINQTNREVSIMRSQANAQSEAIIAEGEAEYMSILSNAYNDPAKSEFYSFVRSLDAAEVALQGGGKTLVIDKDSPLAQIFYNK